MTWRPVVLLYVMVAATVAYLWTSNAVASVNMDPGNAPDPSAAGGGDPATDPAGAGDPVSTGSGLFSSIGNTISGAVSSTVDAVTRGLRNNNPGNIIASSQYTWSGQTGTDGRFAIFATAGDGIRAMGVTLKAYQSKYGLNTVAGIINRWAPPSENNTSAYVSAVAAQMGVGPNDKIDLNDPTTLSNLTAAIIQHENGSQPFDVATISANVSRA